MNLFSWKCSNCVMLASVLDLHVNLFGCIIRGCCGGWRGSTAAMLWSVQMECVLTYGTELVRRIFSMDFKSGL